MIFFYCGFMVTSNALLEAHDDVSHDGREYALSPNGMPESWVVIPPTATSDAYDILKQEGHIRSALTLKIARLMQGSGVAITPGAYDVSSAHSVWSMGRVLNDPIAVWVEIPEGLSRHEMARMLGDALFWDEVTRARFITASVAMQWDAFNDLILPVMKDVQQWNEHELMLFSSMAAFFSDSDYDFLATAYESGSYLVSFSATPSEVAQQLIASVEHAHGDHLGDYLAYIVYDAKEKRDALKVLVQGHSELLPDLVPLPPSDVFFEYRGGPSLVFTTTYWNQGKGPLELIADPKTRGIQGDSIRDVYQRIYTVDGQFRDRLAGTFEWHQEHLHYHFGDFVDYELAPLGKGVASSSLIKTQQKTTYCIRDVDAVSPEKVGGLSQPIYRVCGKERQGISVGWGDSYYYTYPDQSLRLVGLPAGGYRLTFHVNPRGRFKESDVTNNIVWKDFFIDVDAGLVHPLGSR